jgi:hypothetical protein
VQARIKESKSSEVFKMKERGREESLREVQAAG